MRPLDQRKAHGVFYTPQLIADYIVDRTLELLPKQRLPRILDPACGDGVFLTAAKRHLVEQKAWAPAVEESGGEALVDRSLFGVDRDAAAIQAALRRHDDTTPGAHSENLVVADALTDDVFEAESFDAIIGNPPYVNVRILARTYGPQVKRLLTQRYECARGAYDLYVLFLERAFHWLRPGGTCGMIVPNKIATMDYALPARKLLLERTSIQQLTDVTELGAFRTASVYPYILVWRKEEPAATHSASVLITDSLDDLARNTTSCRVRQSSLSPQGFAFHGTLDVEQRVPTLPLGSLSRLHSGTTGFTAARLADELREAEEATTGKHFDFVVSGNIDPYVVRTGGVRYMKRDYQRPVLAVDSSCLSVAKRELFRGTKIVIAGMTKRLEAAYDETGLALGVQVYAVNEAVEDIFYLLGLLNSKLLSHLFRLRFRAKRLAGGYLAINKAQLGQLPIRDVSEADPAGFALRVEIIRAVQEITNLAQPPDQSELTAAMRTIDALVYSLYELTPSEIDQVESATPDFKSPSAAA